MYVTKSQGWIRHIDFILLDILCLHIAFVLAYITRHGFVNPYTNPIYLNIALIYTLVDILVLIVNRTMEHTLKRGYYLEMAKTLKHVLLVVLLVSLYMFSTQSGEDYSRISFFLLALYYCVIAYSVRLLWKSFLRNRKQDSLSVSIFLVATRDRAEELIAQFRKDTLTNYLIQGICITDRDCVGEHISGVPVTTTRKTVLKYLCDKWIDEVMISLPDDAPDKKDLISDISDMGIVVHDEMRALEAGDGKKQVIEEVSGLTVRTISMTMATPLERFLKRSLDILGGIVGCILTGILVIIIGPLIYIKSPGPIFFSQTRVGKNGKKFQMYKFRSMYLDAEERKKELMKQNRMGDGLMFKLEFDPRIIGCEKLPDGTIKKGIGNFIRDWSLDEFPQFFNVLKGDLSLCGTRPPTVDEWERYDLHHRARLAIKPGITGLWQVSGRSNITDFEQVVELDKKYIREWSMGLDLRILIQTVKVVLNKDGSM